MNRDYDVAYAFERIEDRLIESMIRNLDRHRAEETARGYEWEQWQSIQVRELNRFKAQNPKLFGKDFAQINREVEKQIRAEAERGQAEEEAKLAKLAKQGKIKSAPPTDDDFFQVNDQRLTAMLDATRADFNRAEMSMLRKADDEYRQVIFDAQVYANMTNDYKGATKMAVGDFGQNQLETDTKEYMSQGLTYEQAVDKATKDLLENGIRPVIYKNNSAHSVSEYAQMVIRTTGKRAYLMGEGKARDKYGIHTVQVNKRTHACPYCVRFLGKVLVDDVYSGGTYKEAEALGVPTLSQAMDEGFLHPNCKDVYSTYIPDVSEGAEPWTQEEIEEIVGDYNKEQEINHARDMADSYRRMSQYSLDPENQQRYGERADMWDARIKEIEAEPITPAPPVEPVIPEPPVVPRDYTQDELDALEYYVSGDGMWINQYLRGRLETELSEEEKRFFEDLKSATNRPLDPSIKTLYRSVDASAIFQGLSETEIDQMMEHLRYGNYDSGAYSQGIKRKMEAELQKTIGSEITEKGFMSTTTDKEIATEFGDFTGSRNPVVLELDTSNIQLKGADASMFEVEDNPQKERLLAPDVKYRIDSISVERDEYGGKYIKVNATVIGQGDVEVIAEPVAEPVAETTQSQETTLENEIRGNISRLKEDLEQAESKRVDVKGLKKKQDKLDAVYEDVVWQSNLFGDDLSVVIQEQIDESYRRLEKYPSSADAINESLERYKYIQTHLEEYKDGSIKDRYKMELADAKQRDKEAKKQVDAIQKELKKEYGSLEGILGTPNVTHLSIYGDKPLEAIKEKLLDAPERIRQAWNQCADKFRTLDPIDPWGRRRKGAYYSHKEDGVWLSIRNAVSGNDYEPPYEVVFHEYGHNIDYVFNRQFGTGNPYESFTQTYKDGIFGKTVLEEANSAIEKYAIEHGIPVETDRFKAEEMFIQFIEGKYSERQRANLSDMFEPVMAQQHHHPFGFGHGYGYWREPARKGISVATGKEAFAEMYASIVTNSASLELIKEYFPRSVDIFYEILEVTK